MNLTCPLFAMMDNGSADCLEEKCAWWSKQRGKCSIVLIAQELECIGPK